MNAPPMCGVRLPRLVSRVAGVTALPSRRIVRLLRLFSPSLKHTSVRPLSRGLSCAYPSAIRRRYSSDCGSRSEFFKKMQKALAKARVLCYNRKVNAIGAPLSTRPRACRAAVLRNVRSPVQILKEVKKLPNIKSAKKRVLVTATKTLQNKMFKSDMKTTIKKYEAAVEAGDKAAAADTYKAAVKIIDKAVANGIIHKNKAARKKSQFTLALNKLN